MVIQGYCNQMRKRRLYRPFVHHGFVVTLEHRRFINGVNWWICIVTRIKDSRTTIETLELTENFESIRRRIKDMLDNGDFNG